MAENTGLAPVYRYYTADLLTNEILAEIPFRGVSYERAIKGAGSFTGSIPVIEATDNLDLYESTLPGKTALYVVRNGVCVWGGIIWTRSYNVVDRVLQINAAEFTSYFYHRRIWKTWNHQYGATVVVTDGIAEVTLNYGSSTSALKPQASVKLEFRGDDSRYDGTYTVAGTPVPTNNVFYVDKATQTNQLKQVEVFDGVATIHTAVPHNYIIGDLVTVDDGDNSFYNGTHAITAVGGPTLNRFSFLESNNTIELKDISGTATRIIPDGTYTDVTVSVRTDTYDYIRSLINSVFSDFVGLDFPNIYIEPGISYDYDITSRNVANGLASITTDEPHNLSIGQAVQIEDLDPNWDGEYVVTETPTDTRFRFELGGTLEPEEVSINKHDVSFVSAINGTVTITTTEPHGFLVGQNVLLETGIDSGGLRPYLNGRFSISETPTPTTFKYSTASTVNIPTTSLVPATSISSSDINLYPNPSFESVVPGSYTLRTNLIKWTTFFGNSSFFSFSNTAGGGTGGFSYTDNPAYPSQFALRYTVSIPPTGTGSFIGTKPDNASGFDAMVGATYTASVYIYSSFENTYTPAIPWVNSLGSVISVSAGDPVTIPANTLTRLSVTAVAPTNAVTGGVRVIHDSRSAVDGQWFEFTSHMVEQNNQLREYFDGSLPNKYGYDYNWVGPANRSTSIAIGTPVPVRTNLSINPSAEAAPGTETTGVASSTTVTQSAVQKFLGSYSFACTHNGITDTDKIGLKQSIVVAPDVTYAVSARLFIPSTNIGVANGTGRIKIGVEYTDFVFNAVEDSWIRISATVPVTQTGLVVDSIELYPETAWSTGDVIYIDTILVEASSTVNTYFDGNTFSLGDFIYGWAGTPGSSASFQIAPSVFDMVANECTAVQSTEWSSQGDVSLRITPTNSLSNDSRALGWYIPNLVAGVRYTVRAKIRLLTQLTGTLATNSRRIRIMKNDTVQIARSDAAPNAENTVREVSVSFIVPEDATSIRVDLFNGASKGNGDVWWDDLIIVQTNDSGVDVGYFDGDTESRQYYTYEWSGVPHLSPSERFTKTAISRSELTNNVVTLTTEVPHNYHIGRQVVVEGVTPEVNIIEKAFDAIRGVATITTDEPHEFQVGEVVVVSGLRDASDLSKREVSGSNVTFTTRLAHNFAVGDVVTITDLADITKLRFKGVQDNIVTLTTDIKHNITSGDTVTVSDIFDTYPVTSKRLRQNVATLTLSQPHNFKVNDVVSVAGIIDVAEVISKTVENGLAVLTTRFGHNFLEEEEITVEGLGAPYDGIFKIASFTDAQVIYAVEVDPEELIPLTSASGTITGSNSVFNGDYPLTAVTNSTISYYRQATSVEPTAVVGGLALGNSPLNGTYTVLDTPSSTTFRYEKELNNIATELIPDPVVAEDPADQQPPATASVPSIHLGEQTLTSVSRNTITFIQSGIANDVAIEEVSGAAIADSIFNGEHTLDTVTEDTFTYALESPSNVLETSANNLSYVRAYEIFNGTFTVSAVDPVTNTFSYARTHANRSGVKVIGYGEATVRPTAVVSSFGPYPGNANIGIGFSTKGYSGTSVTPTIYRGFELKNVGDALNAYSDSIYGFEYRIDCAYDEVAREFTKTFVLIPIDFPDPPAAGELSPISRFGADKYVFDYPGNIINVGIEESAENSATRFFTVGENDLGPDAGPPVSAASNTQLLDGADGIRRWPLLDDDAKISGVDDENLLYAYAERYLTEARPPDAKMSVSVNGSLEPVVGSYAPGDWCALIVKDKFLLERMASGLEPRTDVIVRKIDSLKVSVPDGTTFPEKVDLILVPEWEVDKRG
jgi:hypothetical protein